METAWLDTFLATPGDDGRVFCGVVDVRRDGDVLFQAARGLASPRWGVPNTLDMRFDVASISKLFTSVAVLQLVAAGSLDLDASIHEYADLTDTTIDSAVTLRHLLTHTSGIADIAEEDEGENYAEVFRVVPCHTITTPRDFLPLFANKPPHFAPGGGSRYCNAGYVVAGMAVERASGASFQEYVEAEVLARADMASSGYFDKRFAFPDLAEGFDPAEDGRLEQNLFAYPPRGAPDGGAFCTAGDLHAFLAALRELRLLPADLTDEFFTPQVASADGGRSGQGFGLEFNDVGYFKDGESEGASGILSHLSIWNADVVILSNTMDGTWPLLGEFVRRARDDRSDDIHPR
ncbi:MAG: serine hydrolase domain-containing protein [Ilumatobacter sp.]|uniref:serine hydrolase domain-containing protein n=1 Tax=Ilumatobacter sp. TaxID=1967498 RepID=UPI00329873D9